jgi:hypothetical protein
VVVFGYKIVCISQFAFVPPPYFIGMAKNPPESSYTVLPTVEQVTGKPARTFAQWVAENKHYFE